MDIGQLRTLVHVAELGSLSKAADKLCTAQPALSRQVRLLEQELGARLFDRHGRGMLLTDQGRVVQRHALRILREFNDIKAHIADSDDALVGHLSIGMPPTISDLLALRLTSAMREMHPNVVCRIVSAYSLNLLEWMHRGELDIVILYDPLAIRSLKSEALIEEQLYLVGSAENSLSLENPVSFATLGDEKLVLPSADHSLRQIAERAADEAGIHLNVVCELDSLDVIKQFTAQGEGKTILPLTAVKNAIAGNILRAAPLVNPTPVRCLELSLPADRPASRLAMLMHDMILTATYELTANGTWPGRMLIKPPQAQRTK